MQFSVYFALLCEGSSDRALVRPLEQLCIRYGADQARGIAPDFGRLGSVGNSIPDRVRTIQRLEPSLNLLFIHRDADTDKEDDRVNEISLGVAAGGWRGMYIPVVPIYETEAWLLLDEVAIRHVAQNPRGRVQLNLPPISQVETTRDPKLVLQTALKMANGQSGRRAKRFNEQMAQHRRRLLDELDIEGPITQLVAWQRLCTRIQKAVKLLAGERP